MHILNKITLPRLTAKEKNIVLAILGGLALFFVLFLFFLAPIRKSITVKKGEWKKLEAQLIENRARLRSSLKTDKSAVESELEVLRRRLPVKGSTSAVLDELTKRGKELNIEFISIIPQEGKALALTQGAAASLRYKKIPIEINMKATYRNLGEYLGIVENLDSGFASVGAFKIKKDQKAPPKLEVNLTVYTYVLEAERGQK